MSTDPLADKYPGWSPYNYTLNHPLNFIDPNGMWVDPIANPMYRDYYGVNYNPGASKFGMVRKNNDGSLKAHQGVDLVAVVGTKTVAVETSIIKTVSDHGELGTYVVLEFKNKDGNTRYVIYSHLSETNVKKGDSIKEGLLIGLTGKTGNAENLSDKEAHLHFAISTDPIPKQGLSTYENPEDDKYIKKIENEKRQEEKNNGK